MQPLEQVELICRRLLAEEDKSGRLTIPIDSQDYLRLARAYVTLMNEHLKLKSENKEVIH